MVLGLLTAVAACPSIVGINETVMQGQRQNAKSRHRGRKSNLIVSCSDPSQASREVNGCYIILRDNKLYVSSPTSNAVPQGHNGHLFAGYYLPHPDGSWGRKGEGMVSTIQDDPPFLNWIYVNKDTYEVKYGTRKECEGHLVGPWNCTPIEKRAMFDGWEGFVVADQPGVGWQLYFDLEDDLLQEKVPPDQRVVEVELIRKEMRIPPIEEEDPEPQ